MNYTEVEAKVREATNDETWGPHGTLMQEIAKFTFTYEHFPEVMAMLWKRMLENNPKHWRRCYKVRNRSSLVLSRPNAGSFSKALLLLAYLLRNGSERVVSSARDHLYDMRPLEDFQYRDDRGKDQGINGKGNYTVSCHAPHSSLANSASKGEGGRWTAAGRRENTRRAKEGEKVEG